MNRIDWLKRAKNPVDPVDPVDPVKNFGRMEIRSSS